jgi:hypothetical protein
MGHDKKAAATAAGVGPGGMSCSCCNLGTGRRTKRAVNKAGRRIAKAEAKTQASE